MNLDIAMKTCIFQFLSGSHAYGTNTPESDMDYRGIYVVPLEYQFSLFQVKNNTGSMGDQIRKALRAVQDGFYEDAINQLTAVLAIDGDMNFGFSTVQAPKGSGLDSELQELRKFMKLAAKNNPNILEYLYIEKGILIEKPIWQKIREKRHLFLSKKVCHSFAGYAHAQLHRIKTHRGYVMSGEVIKPTREEFGLDPSIKFPPENQNAILSLNLDWVLPEVKELVRKEKAYFSALRVYKQYKEWSEKRNPKRRELEKKYMYDTKHGMHLVRMGRMAEEMLSGKGCIVHRPDAEELNEIRNGHWSYEKLVEYADALDARLKPLALTSTLPKEPNRKEISKLYMEICQDYYDIDLSKLEPIVTGGDEDD